MGLANAIAGRKVGLDMPLAGRDMDKNAAVPTPTVGDDVAELAAEAGMIGMEMGSLGLERLFGDDGWESRK
jgi:hypothetical protein